MPPQLKTNEIYLSTYIIERLKELKITSVFGVPGDFNLTFLDVIEDFDGVDWIGCCNELNSAYAADGYARVKQANSMDKEAGSRGISALVTTFGVGELSAFNGVAGAYSERIPIIHIVGSPSTKSQKQHFLLHHTLGDGAFNKFVQAASGTTITQVMLDDARTAADAFDRAVRLAIRKSLPVYVSLPTDMVYAPVDRSSLATSIFEDPAPAKDVSVLPSGEVLTYNEDDINTFIVKEVTALWEQSTNPVLLIDACAVRFGVLSFLRELVDKTKVRYFSTPMGKGALPEVEEQGFRGVYVGECSEPSVRAEIESADLVLMMGSLKSDFNTGEFTYHIKHERVVELHSSFTIINYAYYPGTSFTTLLPALVAKLGPKPSLAAAKLAPLVTYKAPAHLTGRITQKDFWALVQDFFRKNDIILAETGTSAFGMINTRIPENAVYVSQVLWGSIGWTGGALLGAVKAAEESPIRRRTILFIGDGSFQLTVQEVATVLRHGLKPIIFVLNNDGYTIERLINGPNRVYNDVSSWKWQETLSFFNAKNVPTRSWLANNFEELTAILSDPELENLDKAHLIEVKMDKLDAPEVLVKQAEMSAKLNST